MKSTAITLHGILVGVLLTVLAQPTLGRSTAMDRTDAKADARVAEARELVSLVRRHHPIHQWLPVFLHHAHAGAGGTQPADLRALTSAFGGKAFDKGLEEHFLRAWDERNMAEVMAFMRAPEAWHRAILHHDAYAGRLNVARRLYQAGPIPRTADGLQEVLAGTESGQADDSGRISNRLRVGLFLCMFAGHRNQASETLHAWAQFYGTPAGRWFAQVMADGFLRYFRNTTPSLSSAAHAADPA